MKRRVLILGGSDYLGLFLARALQGSDGIQPVLVDTKIDPATTRDIVEHAECDTGNESALARLLANVDSVVNCVAGTGGNIRQSGQALFAVASRSGAPRILQLSTFAAYGSLEGNVTESATLLGDVDDYAAARAEIDRLALAYGSVCLRPGIVYGPGSIRWSGQIGSLLLARRLGDLGAAGDGVCNLLFVDDLVAIMARLVNEPQTIAGAVNLCGRERLTWNDYLMRYAKALGAVPVKRIGTRRLRLETKMMAPPLKIAAMALGKRMTRRLGVPEFISPSLLRVFGQEIVLDNSKAGQFLAHNWTPVAQGLQLAAAWHRAANCPR